MKIEIKKVLKKIEIFDKKKVKVSGWITGRREFQNVIFFYLNDGSCIESIQLVFSKKILGKIEKINLGSAIEVEGIIVYTPNREQFCELLVSKVLILTQASEKYLIQKNEINLKLLRENLEIRHRTKIIRAVMFIRDKVFREIHNFFEKNNFLYVSAPILTSNDGEGAGETFSVISKEKNFFGNDREAFLTVTGQLHVESYAQGFKKVYCFGPTFRAEKSRTLKHAAEFNMLEPEVAFCDLDCIIKLAFKLLVYIAKRVLKFCNKEISLLEKQNQVPLKKRLENLIKKNIKVLDYKEILKILKENEERFVQKEEIKFGLDLTSEHERFLTEVYFKSPVLIKNFPKEIKAFYMKENLDKEQQKTVYSFDLLVEGVGELIGGSQRESSFEKLKKRIIEIGINSNEIKWYLNLRKFGYFSSSGFGLGFERLLMYITGMSNIRDVIPFPVTSRTPINF